MTFSILGRCRRTGMLGMAVASSSPAVAARCAHARAKVGVAASQNITDPTLAFAALDLMAGGAGAREAMVSLTSERANIAYRQLAFVDANGEAAVFSGGKTLGVHAQAQAEGAAAAGNLLANPDVPRRMLERFLGEEALDLGDRLMNALAEGLAAGGEASPVHSAGLLMVRDVAWPVADLRVDWDESDPIGELSALWRLWKPQMDDYVTRGLNPQSAPSFGVAGDP
jgi:uncharacterized Ntn-hydrolase superfamily protein